jgi:hypothetical protein
MDLIQNEPTELIIKLQELSKEYQRKPLFIDIELERLIKYSEYEHPYNATALLTKSIAKFNIKRDDLSKSAKPCVVYYKAMKMLFDKINPTSSGIDDITAQDEMSLIRITIMMELCLTFLKVHNFTIYNTLHEHGIDVNWKVIAHLPIDIYVPLMDMHKIVLDFTGKISLSETYNHCSVIKRSIYEFIRQLILNDIITITHDHIYGDNQSFFYKDITYTSIIYVDGDIMSKLPIEPLDTEAAIQYGESLNTE